MSNLPVNWCSVTLSEICHRIVDGSHNPPKGADAGYPMLSARNIIDHKIVFDEFRWLDKQSFDLEHSRTRVAPGDVLLTIVGTIGRTAVVPPKAQPFALQRSVAVLKPFDEVDSRYLAFALDEPTQQQWLVDHAKGTAQKGVYLKALGELPIPLAPKAEQSRIVEKLEELLSDLDAGVAELKAAQGKLAQYRQSMLKAAVEGALTAEWRAANDTPQESGAELLQRILTERRARWDQKQLAKFAEQGKTPPKDWQAKYPAPVVPDLTDLPPLPTGWVWASVDQLSVMQKYGSSAKTDEDSRGVPVLRMGNIQDGEIDIESLKYLPASHREFPDLLLEDGDLLFNRTNSPELVGKTAVYRSQISPSSYASYLIAVTFSKWCVPELVAAFINSAYGRQWIKSVVTQQVGQANVNGTKLAALTVPLAPFDEQQQIARVLFVQRQSAAHQAGMIELGLRQAAAQRKNLLKSAFAGQLTPQDPNDEPASALLERIRAGRAEQPKQSRSRKTKQPKEIVQVVSQLIDVLAEADDWVSAQEAFRRCGVADGAMTEHIENLYAELRRLDKAGRLAVESVTDSQGRKLYDKLRLRAG